MTTTPDMEITKLIDSFGDDIYALALIVTKDFDSAKEVFVKTATSVDEFSDGADMYSFAVRTYAECKEADSNDNAIMLTGVNIPDKLLPLLEEVLKRPQIVRAAIHMFYENDLTTKQIAVATGSSERYITSVLSDLSSELTQQLEYSYKDICVRLRAEDKTKEYVVRAVTSGAAKRIFEVRGEAVPTRRWKTHHKIIVVVIAAIISIAVGLVIPILQQYQEMREREGYSSFEDLSEGESFSYTYEADEESKPDMDRG